MKNILILACSLLLLSGIGCNKSFLDVKPKDFLSAGNFFNRPDQYVQAVNGIYSPLNGLYTGSMWALAEMRSDNTSYQYNTADRSGFPKEELDEFREIDDNS